MKIVFFEKKYDLQSEENIILSAEISIFEFVAGYFPIRKNIDFDFWHIHQVLDKSSLTF